MSGGGGLLPLFRSVQSQGRVLAMASNCALLLSFFHPCHSSPHAAAHLLFAFLLCLFSSRFFRFSASSVSLGFEDTANASFLSADFLASHFLLQRLLLAVPLSGLGHFLDWLACL